PNPSNGKVSIAYTLSASSDVSVELYDVVGKSLKTIVPASHQGAGTHTQQLTLSELSQGMYFVKLRINENETSVKLFITH
ncbi:MAG: T9SS type A sorting domain-containing protein, partial [Bacteroidia bacterium]|nr:T9SS type A sorting domain-containing protein [Bacteroidia bacterium]